MTPMRRYLAYSLLALGSLALTFAAGRYTTPVKTQIKVETVEHVRTEFKTVQVKGEDRVVIRRIVVERAPDGSSVSTTDEREAATARETTTAVGATEAKTETKSDTTTVKGGAAGRAEWRVNALVGGTVGIAGTNLTSAGGLFEALTTPELVYGAQVERRLVGPVVAGVWAVGGASAGGPRVTGGLSLGVEW